MGSAAFLAPEARISPTRRRPPQILSCCIESVVVEGSVLTVIISVPGDADDDFVKAVDIGQFTKTRRFVAYNDRQTELSGTALRMQNERDHRTVDVFNAREIQHGITRIERGVNLLFHAGRIR